MATTRLLPCAMRSGCRSYPDISAVSPWWLCFGREVISLLCEIEDRRCKKIRTGSSYRPVARSAIAISTLHPNPDCSHTTFRKESCDAAQIRTRKRIATGCPIREEPSRYRRFDAVFYIGHSIRSPVLPVPYLSTHDARVLLTQALQRFN